MKVSWDGRDTNTSSVLLEKCSGSVISKQTEMVWEQAAWSLLGSLSSALGSQHSPKPEGDGPGRIASLSS